jgi:hypothetical protein
MRKGASLGKPGSIACRHPKGGALQIFIQGNQSLTGFPTFRSRIETFNHKNRSMLPHWECV